MAFVHAFSSQADIVLSVWQRAYTKLNTFENTISWTDFGKKGYWKRQKRSFLRLLKTSKKVKKRSKNGKKGQ